MATSDANDGDAFKAQKTEPGEVVKQELGGNETTTSFGAIVKLCLTQRLASRVSKTKIKGTIEYQNGNVYTGEHVNRIREDQGSLTLAKGGAVFSGEWRNDKQNGYGTAIYPDGGSYKGSWMDSKRNGYGVTQPEDQRHNVYTGEHIDRVREGHGTMTLAIGGTVFTGEWHDNRQNGHGTAKGEFKNGKQCGKGVTTLANGRTTPLPLAGINITTYIPHNSMSVLTTQTPPAL
eukprot:gene35452-43713_t